MGASLTTFGGLSLLAIAATGPKYTLGKISNLFKIACSELSVVNER